MRAPPARRYLLLGLLLALGCSRTPADAAPPLAGRLVIFAAASLREAFTKLGGEFERAHAGAELAFNFAGTQELRAQLEHGAPCDLFASADQRHMVELVRASLVSEPRVFARNEPVVVVAKESAGALREFADLKRAARIVVGAPAVPIGRYTLELFERTGERFGSDFRAHLEGAVASRELNVKQVLAKVSLGEAQAGIVYRTDALAAAGRVSVVPIPSDLNVVAEYPIAVAARAARPELARAWLEFVLSPAGQATLTAAGFLAAAPGSGKP